MNSEDIEALKSENTEKIKNTLKLFNCKNEKLFDFQQFDALGQWKLIWDEIFNILNDSGKVDLFPECLCAIRILARDEKSVKSHNIQKDFNILLKLAALDTENSLFEDNTALIVEALKCLCNIVYLSSECRKNCLKNSITDGILRRVRSDKTFPYDIEYFDMKLLFLITALEPESRDKVRDTLNGLTYLTEWLDLKIKQNDKSAKQSELICEILKVLFNITLNVDKVSTDESEILYRRLTAVIKTILIFHGETTDDKQKAVILNSVNLLTNIPTSCLSELIAKSSVHATKEKLFEEKNIRAVEILLEYLKAILNDKEKTLNSEQLLPILTVLVKCVRCNSTLRHYIRSVILPPLKDVSKRPEVGDELRNHLCKFLTYPSTPVSNLAADLLFVCCKENIRRMIKYTGYGNAAGLFANRGILNCQKKENVEYSSDSEDSDTEEYKQMQHGINPVTGCYEQPKPSPLAGMTEDQKEYEAMQLVNLMDKLQKQGIIQPCRVGEDGKPHPVDHILELQEELPNQQLEKNDS